MVVLKFVGDAVLAYFVDTEKSPKTANDVIECARIMYYIIDEVLNPVFKDGKFTKLQIKITVDFGDYSIVIYGVDKINSHIDLIGLTLNLASKMKSISKTHQIILVNLCILNSHQKLKSHLERKKLIQKMGYLMD